MKTKKNDALFEFAFQNEELMCEIRGLIKAFHTLFQGSNEICQHDEDCLDLFFATRILKDKFDELLRNLESCQEKNHPENEPLEEVAS